MGHQSRLVLVVEDDVLVRMNAASELEAAGLEVIAFANADDALLLIESRSDVKAIFTDINMPGTIDGLGLAKAVEHGYPDIAIFVASGKSTSALLVELPKRARFYPKPYEVAELAEAIKAATD